MFNFKRGLAVAGLVIILDQASKYAITQTFAYGETQTVTGFFDLVCAHNTGAAFSLFNTQPGWQREFFIAVSSIASVVILTLLRRGYGNALTRFALSLILGGALGNLLDRLTHGYVIDFLSFHIGAYAWPAFNIADSAISIGAVLLLWDNLTQKKHDASPSRR